MKFAVFSLSALLACACASLLQPNPYYGLPFLSPNAPNVYRIGADQEAIAASPQYALEQGPDGRLFFNLVNSLLTTTKITSTTITSTCTVSTSSACSGKKRSILWREEDVAKESERDDETIPELSEQTERKERDDAMHYAYQVPYFIRPSVGRMPYMPSHSPFYDSYVQGASDGRFFLFVFTSTSTVSFTTTSRSTPTCSSSSNFPTC